MKSFPVKIKENLKAGLTVSLVSIPLSVSLAVASQASPVVGIITAIWAGLIASIFGGSNFNIIGPTGALSGLLAAYSIANGAGALPTLAIVSGIIILIAYLLKFERFLIYIPKSTIVGFTLGVAFIIGFGQFNSAFGVSVPTVHERFIENLLESFSNLQTFSLPTALLFGLFLAVLLFMTKKSPRVPGAIILTPIGILIGYMSVSKILPFTLLTLGDKFPDISPALYLSWSPQISWDIILPAITVAIIAILETMISAKIADGMTNTKYNKRKEMFGLGLANIGSGLMGGIPATAALARTSLNVKSGATYKISATISSISIAVISFVLLTTFKYIPMAVIAAILVFVAIRMVEIKEIKHMFTHDKTAFVISIIVAFITVVEDPIIGILLGTVLSFLFFINKISEGQFELNVNDSELKYVESLSSDDKLKHVEDPHTLVYTIKGQLVYINAQSHLSRFEKNLNGTKNLVLRMRELFYMDIDGVEALDKILEICDANNVNVYITGVNRFIGNILKNSENYNKLEESGHVVNKTKDVLDKLNLKTEEADID